MHSECILHAFVFAQIPILLVHFAQIHDVIRVGSVSGLCWCTIPVSIACSIRILSLRRLMHLECILHTFVFAQIPILLVHFAQIHDVIRIASVLHPSQVIAQDVKFHNLFCAHKMPSVSNPARGG
jgi:hypothetical protein